MSYSEENFASMLFGRFIAEGHINHLSELDPTHLFSHSTSVNVSNTSQTTQVWRAPLPSCVLTDIVAAPVLLELDPTHAQVR